MPLALTGVLDWVNAQREALDAPTLAELPRGRPCASQRCVIARALSTDAYMAYAAPNRAKLYDASTPLNPSLLRTILFPEPIMEFISDFDNGEYPELVAMV